ncbi:hypothetical protein [Dyadobacter arcticus]|uniref:Preprotein translocase subunit SecB n=1 Tax=Dyadobacter arcticus TaxID=1078754 RepID=A0ABX0USU9_9BACT|nr:hypothetical protein [Dyadobacter arcticus]NIJ54715.1 hypothetical protein [Dyadobacter arcticus]
MTIQIESITVNDYKVHDQLPEMVGKTVTFDISINNLVTGSELQQEVILCEVSVRLIEAESGLELVTFKSNNFYNVPGLTAVLISYPDDSVKIPEEIIEVIARVSIGNVRGILFERLSTTILNKMLLPVIEYGDLTVSIPTDQ